MAGYRVYFLGANDKIHNAEELTSDMTKQRSNGHASCSRRKVCPAFELWSGGEKIHVERAFAPKT
jgi:hypothetical protein